MDPSTWTSETWIAVVAAAISLGAFCATALQAKSARDQVTIARNQVAEARRQTELQEQVRRDAQAPYVWLDYRPATDVSWLIELVLRNEGPTIATNVRVTIDPPMPRYVGEDRSPLHEMAGFARGFSSLPPGREMRWVLGAHHHVLKKENAGAHRVCISCDGPDGPIQQIDYVLDFTESTNVSIRYVKTMDHLVEAVKEQTTAIGQVGRPATTEDN